MNISTDDLVKSVNLLRGFGARKIWLFGSGLTTPENARDLDLACEGIPAALFYLAAGRLLEEIGKPVDLVDIDANTKVAGYIRNRGRVLYDGG